MRRLISFAFVLAACLVTSAAERLKVGDKAPPMQVSKWLQGEPVKSFEKGKVYIVEFWASWCGPCKYYIPHLNALHQSFKDKGLVVTGIAIREDEAVDAIKFVKQMGSQMTYRVAIDDESSGKGFMDHAWMHAAETDALPTSFIVNQDGLIAYIGHPHQIKPPLLEQILSGKFDVKMAAVAYERRRLNEAKIRELEAAYELAISKNEFAAAEKTIVDREPLTEIEDRPSLELSRLGLRLKQGDFAASEKIAVALLDQKIEDARVYDGLAWSIATEDKATPALLNLAEKSASKANSMQEGKDPSILETLARVQFRKGDKTGAVAAQEKALTLLPSTESTRTKQRYQTALEAYRAGKLPE